MSAPGRYVWGPLSGLGLSAALITALLDQASKFWVLYVYDLKSKGAVRVTPFLDFVLTWNKGISYGLFQQEGPVGQCYGLFQQEAQVGQWVLLAFKATAVVFLWAWLARTTTRLTAVSLGLIIGGAIGNSVDRLRCGAVADFVLLHLTTANFSFQWYVFNLADTAIVAGVIGLLYDSLWGHSAAKAP